MGARRRRAILTLSGTFSCLDPSHFKSYNSVAAKSAAGSRGALFGRTSARERFTVRGRMPKVACLWPGLPQLWMRGAWSGLALALGFTVLVNVLLMATLVWTEWFRFGLLAAGWTAVGALWVASACASLGWLGASQDPAGVDDGESLFREAQTHYMKGNWFEAETLLNQRLGRNGRDAEASLMLATLKRHTGRLDESLAQLERLERLESAVFWRQEIARERWLIARAREEQDEQADEAEPVASDEESSENFSSTNLHEAA